MLKVQETVQHNRFLQAQIMDSEDVHEIISLALVTDQTQVKLQRINYQSHVASTQVILGEEDLKKELPIINKTIIQPNLTKDKNIDGEFVLLYVLQCNLQRAVMQADVSKARLRETLLETKEMTGLDHSTSRGRHWHCLSMHANFRYTYSELMVSASGVSMCRITHSIERMGAMSPRRSVSNKIDTGRYTYPQKIAFTNIAMPTVLILRNPQHGHSVNVAMRIRLVDLSTVCFLSAMNDSTSRTIEATFSDRSSLISTHPLYFMTIIIEARLQEHNAAFENTLYRIYEVESATEMTLPSWRIQLPHMTTEWLADFDNLLKRLHELQTQMCHFETVSVCFVKWAVFLLKSVDLLEELRAEVGLPPMSKRNSRLLRERIQFTLTRCEYTAAKTKEMLARVKGQINVVGLARIQITTRYADFALPSVLD